MEFVIDQIHVPNKRSFVARKMRHGLKAPTRVHSHKNFELNYILTGSGKRIVGNNISNYEPDDLVLMGPNLPHCWNVFEEDKEIAQCITIHFYENIVKTDLINIPEFEKVVELLDRASVGVWFKDQEQSEIKEKLGRLVDSTGLESYIILLEIFSALLKVEEYEYLSCSSMFPHSYKKDFEKISTIYEYVFNNLQSGLSLDEAARLVNMAPGSFCRYFKKKTNQTFLEYVKNVRVGMAARMLLETNHQISRICYDSGYNSLANFNNQFKEIMGKSPSDYRNCFR